MGVRARGLERLFENAAYGMFDIAVELGNIRPLVSKRIQLQAEDLPELLRRWLQELLFLFSAHRLVFCNYRVKLERLMLDARVDGEPWDPQRHRAKTEIKAVTHHNLSLSKIKRRWYAQIVLDV